MLIRTLYDLKKAHQAWYDIINNCLTNKVFRRIKSETTPYIKTQGKYDTFIVSVYVYDLTYSLHRK